MCLTNLNTKVTTVGHSQKSLNIIMIFKHKQIIIWRTRSNLPIMRLYVMQILEFCVFECNVLKVIIKLFHVYSDLRNKKD